MGKVEWTRGLSTFHHHLFGLEVRASHQNKARVLEIVAAAAAAVDAEFDAVLMMALMYVRARDRCQGHKAYPPVLLKTAPLLECRS